MTGMLRIHFTDEDLSRVRLAERPDPLWELVLGMQQLTAPASSRYRSVVFRRWRRRARDVLRERHLVGAARLLAGIAPSDKPYFPDFLTPAAAGDGLEEGLRAVAGVPRPQLHTELSRMAGLSPLPSWARGLAAGDPDRRTELTKVLRALHGTVIAPAWTGVDALFDADRIVRARALCDGGVEGLLRSLRPFLHWEPPVLSVSYPVAKEIRLEGRGLRLVPSFFCWASPIALADPALPPVLLFPVDHAPALAAVGRSSHPQALGALLGRTRARVLQTLENGTTTGELAGRLTISAASASTHVRSLREAGLACSTRAGAHVLHSLSPLGCALLHGESPAPPAQLR